MATMENEDTIGSGDYLRVACALQERLRDGTGEGASEALTEVLEIAAEEFGIERDGQGKESGEISIMGRERVEIKGCEHSCSDHKELMNLNPKLWGTLPGELLQVVFAHLPVHEISRLQFLSKEWRQIVSSAGFHRVCNEVYPKLVCFITGDGHNAFWVRVLDHLQKWHVHRLVVSRPDVDWAAAPVPNMTAACEDGGLVCFVNNNLHPTRKERRTRSFTVVNPLTRTSYPLPPLFDIDSTHLVRMQVDRKTNAFKVFVFAKGKSRWESDEEFSTHLYDSLTGGWVTTYGSDVLHEECQEDVDYSFATGKLFNIDDETSSRYWNGEDDMYEILNRTNSALYKGRLFVLQLGFPDDYETEDETEDESPIYFIEEFHWETEWVKDKTHRCEPFEHPPKTVYGMILRACLGYLMVIAKNRSDVNKRFACVRAWLYDLSTQKWSTLELPEFPAGRRTYDLLGGTYRMDLMFEPQWGNI